MTIDNASHVTTRAFSCFSVHILLSKMCSGKARGVKFGHSK